MSGTTAFIHHPGYESRGLSPFPSVWMRYKLTAELIEDLGLVANGVQVLQPEPASEGELLLAHTQEYVNFVKEMDARGSGYLDYGDTPAYKGVYQRACLSVGGSLLGANLIRADQVSHAFNPGGGLHHAKRDRAAGFCVFNDIAIVVKHLQREHDLERIAIVDVDGHHSDGTQELLYDEPILKISLHQYDGSFYPGTGRIEEVGRGRGLGYMVNVPLPRRVYDEAYLYAFEELVFPLIKSYQPQIILLQFGVDGHYRDPLVGFSLTTRAYEKMAAMMHGLAHEVCDGRLLVLGGGGYDPRNVARCWAIMLATISGALPDEARDKYEALHDEKVPRKDERVFDEVKGIVEKVKAANPLLT